MKEKIRKVLKENEEICELTIFLLKEGAGHLFLPDEEKNTEMLVAELEDGIKYGGPGDWAYEIAQMVLNEDLEKMKLIKKDLERQKKEGERAKKKRIWQIRLEEDLASLVEKEAKRLGLSRVDIVRLALRKYFKLIF